MPPGHYKIIVDIGGKFAFCEVDVPDFEKENSKEKNLYIDDSLPNEITSIFERRYFTPNEKNPLNPNFIPEGLIYFGRTGNKFWIEVIETKTRRITVYLEKKSKSFRYFPASKLPLSTDKKEALLPGHYKIIVNIDGKSAFCEFDVPDFKEKKGKRQINHYLEYLIKEGGNFVTVREDFTPDKERPLDLRRISRNLICFKKEHNNNILANIVGNNSNKAKVFFRNETNGSFFELSRDEQKLPPGHYKIIVDIGGKFAFCEVDVPDFGNVAQPQPCETPESNKLDPKGYLKLLEIDLEELKQLKTPQERLEKIHRQYRRIVLELHPDINPGDKNKEEKLKEINNIMIEIFNNNPNRIQERKKEGMKDMDGLMRNNFVPSKGIEPLLSR